MSAPAGSYPIPDVALVRDLLGMLFDGLTVKPGPKLDVSASSSSYFAVYVADDGSPVALCACDMAFAANSSAALSMLPPNAAAAALKSKQLTDVMAANLREVMKYLHAAGIAGGHTASQTTVSGSVRHLARTGRGAADHGASACRFRGEH